MRLTRPAAILFALAALAATATAAAQRASSCSRDRLVADLGYDGIDCTNCNISRDYMEFLAEPTISQVRRGGPADGKLRDGDVLVAIDGRLITTRSAWRYLANLSPDETVRLTVRRNGVERDVTIEPEARCREGRSADDDATFTVQGGQIVLSDQSPTVFSRRPAFAPRASAVMPPVSGRVSGQIASTVRAPTVPTGWIGVGLECEACRSTSTREGGSRWTFDEEPVLAEVVREGPAWRAGLRPGDRLLSVDGFSITSPEGGRRWGNFRPGQEIALTVRRSRGMRTFTLDAEDRPVEFPSTPTALVPDNEPPVAAEPPEGRSTFPDDRTPSPSDREPVRMSYDVGGSLVSVEGRRAETYFDRRTGELVIVGQDFTVRVKSKP